MLMLYSTKGYLASLLCGAALLGSISFTHAQGANWSGYTSWPTNPGGAYQANLPAYPAIEQNQTLKNAQTQACTALEADLKQKIKDAAGQSFVYNVPVNFGSFGNSGVYRAPDNNPIVDLSNCNNVTINAPGITFILHRYYSFFSGARNTTMSNITIQGNDTQPMTVDADDYPSSQGTIQSYVPATGVITFKLMKDYDAPAVSGNLTAYTSTGQVYPNGYYNDVYGAYSSGKVVDAANGIYQLTADTSSSRYAAGNLLTLPSINGSGGTFGYFWAATATNLTLKNINCGILGQMLAGVLGGDANFIRFRNGPLPGTNRLSLATCAQTHGSHGNVTFDGCEFGYNTDDSLDIQGNGFSMYYQTSASNPKQILAWSPDGPQPVAANDTVSFFADSNFACILTAKVTGVAPYTLSTPTAADARNLWIQLKRWSGIPNGALYLITLDQNVTGVTSGDFLEDNSNRMASFTMTNCYWLNVGMRVMIEGIQQGNFTHNMFEGVNGGLALVADPYWAQGGTCQNVTVDNNIFRNCKVDGNSNARGALVFGPLWGNGLPIGGQSFSFNNYTVTNNTFTGTGGDSVAAHMLTNLTLSQNLISDGRGSGIALHNCGGGTLFDNSIVRSGQAAVYIDNDSGVNITQNYLNSLASPSSPVTINNSSNIMQQYNTTPAMIPVGKTVSLKAAANGKYVCADNYGNSPLIANRTSVGNWEQYTVVDAGNGNVNLLAHANNEYVCADNAGGSPLIANRTTVGPWETFQWIDLGSGNIGLKSRANSGYVSAVNSGNNPLQAEGTAIGQWETFLINSY